MFYEQDFGFRSALERACQVIRGELEAFPARELTAWPNDGAYVGGWFAFGLYACRAKLARNCGWFPETTRIIEAIPGLNTAGFSVITPGTWIVPHAGTPPQVLRCHLTLFGPPEAWIRVGAARRSYEAGRTLVFDETMVHEVGNPGATPRAILLIDFDRPSRMMEGIVPRDEHGSDGRRILQRHFAHWLDDPAPAVVE